MMQLLVGSKVQIPTRMDQSCRLLVSGKGTL